MNTETDCYKALASAVIINAIDDLTYVGQEKEKVRREALEFLTSEEHSEIRAMWLSWLDLDEFGLRRLVLAADRFGQQNLLKIAA
jgi:hypothetical protein